MSTPSVATGVGTVYLIVAQEDDEHNGGKIVAVFGTKAEAQGFCYRHEPHFYWIARTVWGWPEIVPSPSLPGYYAMAMGDQEYDLTRFPKTDA